MRLDEICKKITTNHLVNYIKWTLILRHDYPNMLWSEVKDLTQTVSCLHSLEDTEKHCSVRKI